MDQVISLQYSQSWYVYTLAYPDGTIFYVGKGTGRRLFSHEKEARGNCDCKKCQTIRAIWHSKQFVLKSIVFETLSESEALLHEKGLIKLYAQTIVNIQRPRVAEVCPVKPVLGETFTLRDLRRHLSLTVFDLSVEAKVSISTINRLERIKSSNSHSVTRLKAYKVVNTISRKLNHRIGLEEIVGLNVEDK